MLGFCPVNGAGAWNDGTSMPSTRTGPSYVTPEAPS